jgi:hypothetical protein
MRSFSSSRGGRLARSVRGEPLGALPDPDVPGSGQAGDPDAFADVRSIRQAMDHRARTSRSKENASVRSCRARPLNARRKSRALRKARAGYLGLPAATETHPLELLGRCIHRAFPLSITPMTPLQQLIPLCHHFATFGAQQGAFWHGGVGRAARAMRRNRPELLKMAGGG